MNAYISPLGLMPSDIPTMERCLSEAGVSVDQFCDRAEINRSTWTRWKRRTVSPTLDAWDRAVKAYGATVGTQKKRARQ